MEDSGFDFLYENNCLVHPALHRAFDSAAFNGSPLPRILECAKLYDETSKVVRGMFPKECCRNGKLWDYCQEHHYYYQNYLYSWELPCYETIHSILNNCPQTTPILEVGSGPGLYSAILSHYRTVYPTDVKLECDFVSRRYMPPLLVPSKESIPNNPHTFILSVFPYPEMISDILNLSAIGQRICLIIPPLAGISGACLAHIFDQYPILDRIYSFEGMFEGKPPHKPRWTGIIFEKTADWKFTGNYRNDSIFDRTTLGYYSYDEVLADKDKLLKGEV